MVKVTQSERSDPLAAVIDCVTYLAGWSSGLAYRALNPETVVRIHRPQP